MAMEMFITESQSFCIKQEPGDSATVVIKDQHKNEEINQATAKPDGLTMNGVRIEGTTQQGTSNDKIEASGEASGEGAIPLTNLIKSEAEEKWDETTSEDNRTEAKYSALPTELTENGKVITCRTAETNLSEYKHADLTKTAMQQLENNNKLVKTVKLRELQIILSRVDHKIQSISDEHCFMKQSRESAETKRKENKSVREYSEAVDAYDGFVENDIKCEKDTYASDCSETEKLSLEQEEPFECNICNCSVSRRMQIHSEIKAYSCEMCGKAFHRKDVSQERKNRQKTCELDTDKSYDNENKNTAQKKSFACKTCGSKFSYKSNLVRHSRMHGGIPPHKCETCGKTFHRKDLLNEHKHSHSRQKKGKLSNSSKSILKVDSVSHPAQLVCETCGKVFACESVLVRHIKRMHTSTKSYKCEICHKIFFRKDNFKEHRSRHDPKGEGEFKCSLCGAVFRMRNAHYKHKLFHNGIEVTCEICGQRCEDAGYLKTHTKSFHPNMEENHYKIAIDRNGLVTGLYRRKKSTCEICGDSFSAVYLLKRHMILHADNAENRCQLCHKKCVCLKEHMLTHTGEKNCVCEICGKRFNTRSHMTRHLKIHSNVKRFECSVCGRKFSSRGACTAHLRNRHSDNKRYKCDICGKGFVHKCYLENHKRIHTGEKFYVCEICGMGFITSNLHYAHKKLHIDELPHHRCQDCGEKFLRKMQLDVHIMQKHSGDRRFKCGICGKGFILNCSLTRHEVVHSGVRPFNCDICGKRFNQSGSLTRHIRIHTGEKPFKCDHCGMKFNQTSGLKSHMKRHQ